MCRGNNFSGNWHPGTGMHTGLACLSIKWRSSISISSLRVGSRVKSERRIRLRLCTLTREKMTTLNPGQIHPCLHHTTVSNLRWALQPGFKTEPCSAGLVQPGAKPILGLTRDWNAACFQPHVKSEICLMWKGLIWLAAPCLISHTRSRCWNHGPSTRPGPCWNYARRMSKYGTLGVWNAPCYGKP